LIEGGCGGKYLSWEVFEMEGEMEDEMEGEI
jgi:hypothetical protein